MVDLTLVNLDAPSEVRTFEKGRVELVKIGGVAIGRGIFEPVCTHPDHRGRGLALAAMREGLRRLRALGAEYAFVETGDLEPANALYDAVGFSEAHLGHYWSKAL